MRLLQGKWSNETRALILTLSAGAPDRRFRDGLALRDRTPGLRDSEDRGLLGLRGLRRLGGLRF